MVDTTIEGGLLETLQPAGQTVPSEESRHAEMFRQYRNRMSDIDDETWADLIRRMQAGESNRSLARTILEAGLCAHLTPKSIEVYLGKCRAALGIPASTRETNEQEDPADQPIEVGDALRHLRWLRRTQFGRVKKAMRLERMMGDMLPPQAITEMKFLADLADKEMNFLLKAGEWKSTVEEEVVTDEGSMDLLPTDPAKAMRVLMAVDRLFRAAQQEVEAEDSASCTVDAGDPTGPAEAGCVLGGTAEERATQAGAGDGPRGPTDRTGGNPGENGRPPHETTGDGDGGPPSGTGEDATSEDRPQSSNRRSVL